MLGDNLALKEKSIEEKIKELEDFANEKFTIMQKNQKIIYDIINKLSKPDYRTSFIPVDAVVTKEGFSILLSTAHYAQYNDEVETLSSIVYRMVLYFMTEVVFDEFLHKFVHCYEMFLKYNRNHIVMKYTKETKTFSFEYH